MRKFHLVGWALIAVFTASPALGGTQRGIISCASGTFVNTLSCSPSDCVGDLVTCTGSQVFSAGSATVSYLQGVCDDTGPVPCGGMFTSYVEGCGYYLNSHAGLVNSRSRGTIRICYDPLASGDCSGAVPVGTVIGTATVSWEHSGTGAALVTVGDYAFSQSVPFTFNGGTHKIKVKLATSVGTTQSGSCTTPCGFSGCVTKTK